MKPSLSSSVLQSARQVLYWGPLVATPLMLNVRWFYLGMAPNEYPKWAVFLLLGVSLVIGFVLMRYAECRRNPRPTASSFRPGVVGALLLLYIAGLVWGVSYAPNPDMAFVRLSFDLAFAITLCAVVWGVLTAPVRYARHLQMALVLAAVILTVCYGITWFSDVQFNGADWPVRFSNIGHQNFTGDVLVTLIPLLVWTAAAPEGESHRRLIRGGAIFALLICAFMLIAGGMVGAMAGLGLGLVIAGIPVLRSRPFRLQARRWVKARPPRLGWWLLAVIVSLGWGLRDHWVESVRGAFAFSAWDMPVNDETNLKSPQPPLSPLWTRLSPVFGRRVPMWASTTGMIADRPWTGFGTDAFATVYPAYSDRYPQFRDPENFGGLIKTNPHNAYLQVAAENGIPMLLLFVAMLATVGARLIRWLWRQPGVESFCAVWAFAAMVFDAGFNHVFFNPASLFMVALAFGFWWARSGQPRLSPQASPCILGQSALLVVLAIGLTLLVATVPARWLMSEYSFVSARNHTVHGGVNPRHLMAEWRQVLGWFPANNPARYSLGQVELSNGHSESAAQTFQALLRRAPYNVPGLSGLAAAQVQLHQLEAAVATLQRAQALEPDEVGYQRSIDQLQAEMARTDPP